MMMPDQNSPYSRPSSRTSTIDGLTVKEDEISQIKTYITLKISESQSILLDWKNQVTKIGFNIIINMHLLGEEPETKMNIIHKQTGNEDTNTRPPPSRAPSLQPDTVPERSLTNFPTKCTKNFNNHDQQLSATRPPKSKFESLSYIRLLLSSSFILLFLLSFSSNHHHQKVLVKAAPSPASSASIPSVISADTGEDGSRECYDKCDCGMKRIELRIKCFTECLAKCLVQFS